MVAYSDLRQSRGPVCIPLQSAQPGAACWRSVPGPESPRENLGNSRPMLSAKAVPPVRVLQTPTDSASRARHKARLCARRSLIRLSQHFVYPLHLLDYKTLLRFQAATTHVFPERWSPFDAVYSFPRSALTLPESIVSRRANRDIPTSETMPKQTAAHTYSGPEPCPQQ